MARLLFLGASVSQLPAIRYAKEVGHWVAACDGDAAAVAFALCDVTEVVDFSDVAGVEEVVRRHGIEGVLAVCTDRAVVPAARVAARTGLAGMSVEVATAMTHKPTMRRRLQAAGVAQPRFAAVRSLAELEEATGRLRFPAVLKPADSGGQRGLFAVDSLERARERLPLTLAASRAGEAIVEEFVAGSELNALVAVRDGVPTVLTLSDRLRPAGPGFGVGWIHSFPSSLPAEALESAERTAASAVRALGLRDGIAFPQLIATGDRVVVVEVAARIAAGQMADLVRLGTGIELFEIAIHQALGDAVPDELIRPRLQRPIAIRFLTASPGVLPVGTVTKINGLSRVRRSAGVLACGLYFGPGARIRPVQVDADRMGYVIATASTASEALELAERAARRLLVEVAETSPRHGGSHRRATSWLGIAATLILLCGTIVIFAATERAKLAHALVLGTRVDQTFSPLCGCARRDARIVFRLGRSTLVTVGVVNSATRLVTTLIPLRHVRAGWLHLVWNGRGSRGWLEPDGRYRPRVRFPTLDRTLVLPSPIVLDTDRPRIDGAVLGVGPSALTVRYRFGEPAQAALLVDGQRAVLTRGTSSSGTLDWGERFPDGQLLAHGTHRIALVAIDLAGNRSTPTDLGTVHGP